MTGWKLLPCKYLPLSGYQDIYDGLNGFLGQVSALVRHDDKDEKGQAHELPLPWSDWDCVPP